MSICITRIRQFLVAGVLLLTIVPTMLTTTTEAAGAANTPRCNSDGIEAWLQPSENGTAGTIYYVLEFTNFSSGRCTLQGFPTVTGRSFTGDGLGSSAARQSGSTRLVTVTPGQSAIANLGIVEAGNFPSSTCHVTTAASLGVAVPGSTTIRTVPFVFRACSRSGPRYLTIGPLKVA